MIHRTRHSVPLLIAGLAVALGLAACGPTTPSSAPPSPPPSAAAPSTAVPTVSPSPSTAPSATPSPTLVPTATPSPTASPTPTAAEACAIVPQTGRLPSDRMVNVKTFSTPTSDVVQFVFGNMSVPEPPQGASKGSLAAAVPPYTQAASGQAMDVTGQHVAQVRFDGMSLMNDAGEPTYDGPLEISTTDKVSLRQVSNFDMSEGVIGWYIGYDGPGCVTLTSNATSVSVVIDHAAG